MRIFDNNLTLTQDDIESRLRISDSNAIAECYSIAPPEGGETHYYVGIDSTQTDLEIENILSKQYYGDLLSFSNFVNYEKEYLKQIVGSYILSKYPDYEESTILGLQIYSDKTDKKAADAYVRSYLVWINSCYNYLYQMQDSITSISNDVQKTEVQKRQAIQLVVQNVSFTSLDASNPQITSRHITETLGVDISTAGTYVGSISSAESETVSSTTLASYQTKVSLSISTCGTYEVSYCAELTGTTQNKNVDFKCSSESSTLCETTYKTPSANFYQSQSGVKVITVTDQQTVSIFYRVNTSNSGTASIRNARITARRVS